MNNLSPQFLWIQDKEFTFDKDKQNNELLISQITMVIEQKLHKIHH